MTKNTLTFFLVAVLFVFITFPATVLAQEKSGIDLTISPALLELENVPGTKMQERFRIRNNSTRPINLLLSVDKLNGSDIHGRVVPVKPEPGDPSPSWIVFQKNKITALAREWTEVQFELDIPKDAAFGYYYAVRIAQAPEDIPGKTNETLLGEVILPILLEVKKSGAVRSAALVEFRPQNVLNEYLPVTFVTTLSNTGNVHMKPRGNIFIRGLGDEDIGILDLNPGLGNILPGNKRTFEGSWGDGFVTYGPQSENGTPKTDANGRPAMGLTFNWNRLTAFRIGKYTANLLAVYDNGQRDVVLEGTTTFWVIPYKIIGGILLITVLIILLIRYLLRSYVKQQIRKYQNAK